MTNQGLLQAKINVKNEIDLKNGFSSGIVANPLLKSIEGKDGVIKLSNKNAIVEFNKGNSATQHIDTIVYDDSDLDQQRMHLDTYFNILNEKYVIALDFDETGKAIHKKIGRKVLLFDNSKDSQEIECSIKDVITKVGEYKLVKVYDDFYTFLGDEQYEIIKVTNQQQIDYMINFLNIGNNTVLTCNRDLKNVVKHTGVNVIYIEFRAVMNMYGALHCATQVSRKI